MLYSGMNVSQVALVRLSCGSETLASSHPSIDVSDTKHFRCSFFFGSVFLFPWSGVPAPPLWAFLVIAKVILIQDTSSGDHRFCRQALQKAFAPRSHYKSSMSQV